MVARRGLFAGLLASFGATLVAAGTNEEGKKFLEENGKREGVVTLPSGLQYKVLRKGKGKFAPKADTTCSCHYAGTTPALTKDAHEVASGDESKWEVFDSSYARGQPTDFAPNQVIKGWTEAMQLMVEGDKWEMYIPSELGYGDSGSGEKIKGGDVLIFRMEIIKIQGKGKRIKKCTWAKIGEEGDEHGCDDDEVTTWNEWKEKETSELSTKVEGLKKRLAGTLKAGESGPIVDELAKLKPVLKARKKADKKAAKKEL